MPNKADNIIDDVLNTTQSDSPTKPPKSPVSQPKPSDATSTPDAIIDATLTAPVQETSVNYADMSWREVITRATNNYGSSWVKNLASLKALGTKEGLLGLGKVAATGMAFAESMVTKSPPKITGGAWDPIDHAVQIVESVVAPYTSTENIKRYIAEDPVAFTSDLLTIVPYLGQVGKVTLPAKVVNKLSKPALWKTLVASGAEATLDPSALPGRAIGGLTTEFARKKKKVTSEMDVVEDIGRQMGRSGVDPAVIPILESAFKGGFKPDSLSNYLTRNRSKLQGISPDEVQFLKDIGERLNKFKKRPNIWGYIDSGKDISTLLGGLLGFKIGSSWEYAVLGALGGETIRRMININPDVIKYVLKHEPPGWSKYVGSSLQNVSRANRLREGRQRFNDELEESMQRKRYEQFRKPRQ